MKRYATILGTVLAGMIVGGAVGVPASYWAQPPIVRLLPISTYLINELPQAFGAAPTDPFSTSLFFARIVWLTVALCSVLGGCVAFAVASRFRA